MLMKPDNTVDAAAIVISAVLRFGIEGKQFDVCNRNINEFPFILVVFFLKIADTLRRKRWISANIIFSFSGNDGAMTYFRQSEYIYNIVNYGLMTFEKTYFNHILFLFCDVNHILVIFERCNNGIVVAHNLCFIKQNIAEGVIQSEWCFAVIGIKQYSIIDGTESDVKTLYTLFIYTA